MAFFSSEKDKQGGNQELVLAYLEDAFRQRSRIVAMDARKVESEGTVLSVDENAASFSLSLRSPFPGTKDSKAGIILYHDNLRLWMECTVSSTRGNTLSLDLPPDIELKERRKFPRVKLNSKEGATLTGLSGLFDGIGIHGVIESISESGCRVKVDKAINIKNDKRLPLGRILVPEGHPFPIVKLNKVPRCPSTMEISGKVIYLDDSSGLCIGIEFNKNEFSGALRNLVTSRTGTAPTAVPPKQRRKHIENEENKGERESKWDDISLVRESRGEAPQAMRTPLTPEPPPEPNAAPSLTPNPGPPQADRPLEASAATEAKPNLPSDPVTTTNQKNPHLVRLKKRSRTILVLANEERGIEIARQLLQEGYKQVIATVGWEEVITHLNNHDTDLLLLDSAAPASENLAMIRRLREVGLEMPPIVMAEEDFSIALIEASRRLGISHLLVRPFDLDDSFSRQIEKALGI